MPSVRASQWLTDKAECPISYQIFSKDIKSWRGGFRRENPFLHFACCGSALQWPDKCVGVGGEGLQCLPSKGLRKEGVAVEGVSEHTQSVAF